MRCPWDSRHEPAKSIDPATLLIDHDQRRNLGLALDLSHELAHLLCGLDISRKQNDSERRRLAKESSFIGAQMGANRARGPSR